jgi:hypothetical protein
MVGRPCMVIGAVPALVVNFYAARLHDYPGGWGLEWWAVHMPMPLRSTLTTMPCACMTTLGECVGGGRACTVNGIVLGLPRRTSSRLSHRVEW